MKSRPTISVFTATFNRRETLGRVFYSLREQSYRDFEWIIIDDGSTDETTELVRIFQNDANFPIRYFSQENRGKHTAYNLFAKNAFGKYYCSIDSDDEVHANCLERLLFHFETIPEGDRDEYAGVMCLADDQHGNLIGDLFYEEDFDDDLIRVLMRHKKLGDKGGLTKTSVLREYPFPEEVVRVYVPESIYIHAYSRKYKTKYVNEILIRPWTDPRPDHLSNALQERKNYPGTSYGLLAWPKYSMRYFFYNPKLYIAVTSKYISIAFSINKSLSQQFKEMENFYGRLLWFMLLPLGVVRYLLEKS
jgi:glycosyltransferase involved in cell wall biosynthesis